MNLGKRSRFRWAFILYTYKFRFQTGLKFFIQNSQNYSCFIECTESWVVCMEKGKLHWVGVGKTLMFV